MHIGHVPDFQLLVLEVELEPVSDYQHLAENVLHILDQA